MSEEVKKVTPGDGVAKDSHADSKANDKTQGDNLSNPELANKSRAESMEDCMGKSLDELSKAFMASAKRWEMIVYPSLFAFILLAAYGFFLIYSLTNNISRVADDMSDITKSMSHIVVQMDTISKNMVVMTQTIDSQSASMKEMTYHMRGMNVSMSQMRYDFSVLNNSVSRPMSFMNTFMPW